MNQNIRAPHPLNALQDNSLLLARTFAVLKHQREILESSARQAISRAEKANGDNTSLELKGIASGLRQGLEDALLVPPTH